MEYGRARMQNGIDTCDTPWPGPGETPVVPITNASKVVFPGPAGYTAYTIETDTTLFDEYAVDWLGANNTYQYVPAGAIDMVNEDTYITEIHFEYSTGWVQINLESAEGFHARRQA